MNTEIHDLTLSTDLRDAMRKNLDAFNWQAADDSGLRRAAVAMTIVNADSADQQEACFILTRRASKLKNHGGQWALPGGRIDEGETAEQCVLRELSEEVGLKLGPEHILGRLDDYATRSGYCISPFVLWSGVTSHLEINPDEVAFARRVPLSNIKADCNPQLSHIEESEKPVLSLHFDHLGHEVYAPTAAVIHQTFEVAIRARACRTADFEQPLFAWR